jgi:hypothetical protein
MEEYYPWLANYRSNPELYKQFEEWCFFDHHTIKPEKPLLSSRPNKYLLTFTREPDTPLDSWFQKLLSALSTKLFLTLHASIEHIETNIHCHALVTTKYANLSRDKFKSWCKGAKNPARLLDIRKVKFDNGCIEYINKETKEFDNLKEFENYYIDLIYKQIQKCPMPQPLAPQLPEVNTSIKIE